MQIKNRTHYPTEQIEELCRFVLGARYEPLAARATLVVSDDPQQASSGDGSRPPPNLCQQVTLTVGVADPDTMSDLGFSTANTEIPLPSWRDKFVFNLAQAVASHPAISQTPETLESVVADVLHKQQGMMMVMQRYWEAQERRQFSWQG